MYNYTGSSCADIYLTNPETRDKSGYYYINDSQGTYCNMKAIAIANGDFITTCAGVGGGWRRIVNINISAGDDCPGEWRKATQSIVSFCRVASDDYRTCSSASFSTNGISYQRVCGRARGYQKGNTVAFFGSWFNHTIDEDYMLMDYQSLTVVIHVNTFGLLQLVMVKGLTVVTVVLVPLLQHWILLLMLVVTIIVSQAQHIWVMRAHIILMTYCGMEQDV